MKIALWAVCIMQALVIGGIFLILLPLVSFDGVVSEYPDYHGALHAAMELGRLDLVSAIVTAIGILFGMFAIIGFGYIVQKAEAVAKEAAEVAAKKRIEEILPDELSRHMTLLAGGEGNRVAENVDPANPNG